MFKYSAVLSVVLLVSACGDDGPGDNNNANENENQTQPICGNDAVELGEQCDDGASNSDSQADACRTDCRSAYCGDRVVDTGEGCDDGPSNSDFLAGACRSDCQPFHCGDGVADPGEDCDDANGAAGDGCSDQCLLEDYWRCSGAPSVCECLDYRLGDNCAQCRVFVTQDATGSEADGLTWTTAFPTVQQGIDAAYEAGTGCEVWVAGGTYRIYQTSMFNTVELRSGVAVFGGFSGVETDRSQRDWEANETILDGETVSADMAVMHVVTAEEVVDATLDGFVVQWGFAQGPRYEDNLGAGLHTLGSVLTIENCRFENNYAIGNGGGLYSYGSDLVIRDSSFVGNSTREDGGGLLLAASNAELSGCEIRGNETFSAPSLNGGGLNLQASEVSAVNCLIVDNQTTGSGGGIYTRYTRLSLLHCTLADNLAMGSAGDSIHDASDSLAAFTVDVTSSLIVGDLFPDVASHFTANYSLVPSTAAFGSGVENSQGAPGFAANDYHLTNVSDCIDRADGLSAPQADIEGTTRYDVNSQTDIYILCGSQPDCVSYADCGAYEYHP